MADFRHKWDTPTARTTGISAAALSAGANVLGSAIDNATDKDQFASGELQITFGSAPAAGGWVELYFLKSTDGTNYEDGDATPIDPPKSPDKAFYVRAVTTAQRIGFSNVRIPAYKFKCLLKSEASTNASSATLVLETHNQRSNQV